jgi:SAM-dependent methyltransferase
MSNAVMRVDPSNAEQARAWDGGEGGYWAEHAERFDRSVAAYHDAFLDASAIGATDRVLDIGCGSGQTTRDAARAAADGMALGVDLSAKLIEVARQEAAKDGVTNARFEHADAQIHAFDAASYDVAISRTGAMFFGDPVAAFANIADALRPQGRLVLLTWQPLHGNEWIAELSMALAVGRDLPAPPPDAPGPFSLSDPDRVRAVLGAAGFADIELDGARRPMWFGDDADDAHRFVVGLMGWMLQGLNNDGRARALESLRRTVAAHQTPDGVEFDSSTWTIRATRP